MDRKILSIVADNPTLISVLREVFEEKFSVDGINIGLDNEVLGQMVRARIVGLKALDEGFKEIDRYKTVVDRPPTINKAR